ncbi:hypothetical protein E6R60_33560 [Streptomyces sp. A0642]|uniref:hypothetical protein n=1 Tax=Streptomyces sp. A0642 TaxID=2563100 RepID=UPI0010A277E8|nr:hypothetical protein [Streptomyces sp. A0642]THA65010.1 hypothetical protein E6R60_33560 [Streptomyces sp. A0642]
MFRSRREAGGLRDRPDLLTRSGAEPSRAGTAFRDPERTVVHPRYAEEDGPAAYIDRWVPEDGTLAEARAADAPGRLAAVEPRTYGA